MGTYAAQTSVSVEKSRREIENTLTRYGATHFGYVMAPDGAQVAFRFENRSIRFSVRLPSESDRDIARTPTGLTRAPAARREALKQASQQRWRALALIVKAKLEAVQSGIATFEEEFYAYTVLPSGRTIFEETGAQVEHMISSGRTSPLMLES